MIRITSPNDIPAILSIETETQIAPWSLETFLSCLQRYIGYVLEINDEVVGFIWFSLEGDECHILNLAIAPGAQRKGCGKQLMEYALDVAVKKKISIAYLEVRRSNEKAINLYDKLGFIQIAERKNYYPALNGREDALLFAKDLRVE